MPRKIAQCVDCGQVKTILARGLCSNCYDRYRYVKKHPPKFKTCANPKCNKPFTTTRGYQKYCSLKCQYQAIFRRKHPLIPRICANPRCAKVFSPNRGNQKYCSLKCARQVCSGNTRYKGKWLQYVRKGKCPKCHSNYYGRLFQVTRYYKGKKGRTHYEIYHFRSVYIPKRMRKGRSHYKAIHTGSCTFSTYPIIY